MACGVLLGLTVLLIFAAAGCSQQIRPPFDATGTSLIWPPAPLPPRIRYVGQLRSAKDLNAPSGFFDSLGNLLLGPPDPEPLYGPRSIVVTGGGQRVWVADPGGRRLHRFDLEGRLYQCVTRVGSEPLLSPVDLCPGEPGSLYVCDSEAVAIHRISELDGSLQASLRLPVELLRPVGLHYEPASGELYVADAVGHDLKVLDASGRLVRILGRRGTGPGEFNFPCDLAAADNQLWVVDAGNHRVQALTPNGDAIASFGSAGDAPGDLALPKGIAFDSDGNLYVVDARFENVQIFDQAGRLLLFFGQEGIAPGEFALPGGICVDALDRVWVCDTYNGRVQIFQYVKTDTASEAQFVPNNVDETSSSSTTTALEARVTQ